MFNIPTTLRRSYKAQEVGSIIYNGPSVWSGHNFNPNPAFARVTFNNNGTLTLTRSVVSAQTTQEIHQWNTVVKADIMNFWEMRAARLGGTIDPSGNIPLDTWFNFSASRYDEILVSSSDSQDNALMRYYFRLAGSTVISHYFDIQILAATS